MARALRPILKRLAVAAAAVLPAAALVAAVRAWLPAEGEVLVLLLSVLLAGYWGGVGAGLPAAVVALAAWVFLVAPPRFTAPLEASSLAGFGVFVASALITAMVAGRLRQVTDAQRVSRRRAAWLAERLQQVQALTEAPLASDRLDALVVELLANVRRLLEADTVAVLLLDEATEELVARAAVGLEEEVEAGVRIPLRRGFAGRVAAERRPVVIEDVRPGTVINPILLEKGIRSLLGVPMIIAGRLLGVMHVGMLRPRAFSSDEVQLLQLTADRVGLAIENVRELEARERRAESLAALIKVSTDIHSATRIEEVMQAIAEAARRLAGGGVAFAGFFRGRGEPDPTEYQQWEVAGYPREAFQHLDRLHITPLFEPTFRAQGTVRSNDIRIHPLFRGLPDGHVAVVSYLAVPVVARSGQSMGAILLGHPEAGRFDEHTQTQVEALASQAGLALENAVLYEREHSTAATLQRSLLPDRVPEIPGIRLAVRYLASGTGEVGGDWYDVLELGDGNLSLVMGDVVGRGVRAAAVMGQLRNALRAYAMEDARPAVLARRLNTLSERLGAPNLVTLVYLLFDLSTLSVRYVRAGHLPPLVIAPDGAAVLLEGGHALPLGVNRDTVFEEGHARIRPGSTLILYTDGLVDHPDVPLDEALLRLREVALGAHARGPEELLDELLRAVLPGGSRHDDVAVLALQVAALGDRLNLRVPAEPSSVATLRQILRRWLGEQELTEEGAFPLLVATGEAISNTIEHAYGPAGGHLVLDARRDGDEVTVIVRDFGQWRPARGT
ncbi:MAG TPA: SpoIIE family protein phosphatase, partial [bacterium]|nr:SpoIIE family protein phosphatase [bacterium]